MGKFKGYKIRLPAPPNRPQVCKKVSPIAGTMLLNLPTLSPKENKMDFKTKDQFVFVNTSKRSLLLSLPPPPPPPPPPTTSFAVNTPKFGQFFESKNNGKEYHILKFFEGDKFTMQENYFKILVDECIYLLPPKYKTFYHSGSKLYLEMILTQREKELVSLVNLTDVYKKGINYPLFLEFAYKALGVNKERVLRTSWDLISQYVVNWILDKFNQELMLSRNDLPREFMLNDQISVIDDKFLEEDVKVKGNEMVMINLIYSRKTGPTNQIGVKLAKYKVMKFFYFERPGKMCIKKRVDLMKKYTVLILCVKKKTN